jgi:YVTN family beta-propeller protein
MLNKKMAGARAAMVALAVVCLASCGGGDEAATDATTPPDGRVRAQAVTPAQAALARWTAPIGLPLVPISGAVLNTGKVLFWSADVPNNETYGFGGTTSTALFDPATNTATARQVNETNHDMFCPGTTRLADGRLLVNGGYDSSVTSLYDPANNSWARAANMSVSRGYNSNTLLSDGSVLTVGGSWRGGAGPKVSEVFTLASGWRQLSGVSTANTALITGDAQSYSRADNHMWLIPVGNGRVLHAGPAKTMNWIDTRGNGSIAPAGLRSADTDSMNGNAVMVDAGKILTLGGGVNYDSADGKKAAFVIDVNSGAAVARAVAPMAYGRTFSNSVVLPTGQVVVMGGQTRGVGFSDDNAVLPAELWDPQTETFTVLPAMSVARNYHSIGLLLPDGRVISAGGGLCNCAADHADMQILSPPYLFNADGSAATRPAVTAAPTVLTYGSTASVTTDSTVAAFSLVRLGATTHTVNNDQRRIALTFTAGANNTYQLAIPTNPGILLPGQWMLFAMNVNGTPSVAKMVTVSNANAPVLLNPGDVATSAGQSVNVAVSATTPTGTLAFTASGLPAGLSINAATGAITGTVTTAGRYVITVRAANGTQTVSTDVVIRVEAAGANSGTGLLAQYFGNTTLSGTVTAQRAELPGVGLGPVCATEGGTCTVNGTQLVTYGAQGNYVSRLVTGSIACDYTVLGDPAPGIRKACYAGISGVPGGVAQTNFSARWNGLIEAGASGPTQFQVLSAAGVRVWVNRQLVIDNWAAHTVATNSGTVTLAAGQRYPVMVEYFQNASAPQLQLLWQPAGESLAAVPLTRLYPSSAPSTSNIAQGRSATQSSTDFGGDPGRAVDGNTDGTYGNNSVTHSGGFAAQDWWQVDLGRKARIDLVRLWNRTDCCSDRLGSFMVFVADSDMTGRTLDQLKADTAVTARSVGTSSPSSVTPNIGIPIGIAGRYLRVQLTGTNNLSLAEVQVFGDATVYQPPTFGAIANQQSALGASVSLNVSATDPGGYALTYSATGLPAGLSINAQTGAITGTTTTTGPNNVTVSVVNAGYASASTSFTWTVLGPVPQVVSLPAPVTTSGSTVTYNPVISNGANAQYSWNFGDGSGDSAYAANAGISHVFAAPGVYAVTLSIRSVDGQISTQRFSQAIYASGPTALARASSTVMLEPRSGASTRLWVVNSDNDSVSVFDTANNAKLAEIAVGSAPRTLALAPDGRVWVVNKQGTSISIVSASSLTVAQTLSLPRASQPHGIVFSPAGSAFVTLEATGQLLKLNGSSGATLGTLAVGTNPRQLGMTASGDRLLVSRFITRPLPGEGTATVSTTDALGAKLGGEVLVIDPANLALLGTTVLAHSERADAENQGRGIPNYLGAAAIAPDGKSAWVPGKQDNIKRGSLRDGNALNFQSTVRSISARIDLGTMSEDLAGRVDHDNAGVAGAAVYHPTGAYLFVALETNRQVAVLDAAGKRELFRYEVGLAPQGLVVSADGLKLYVSNFMGRSVSVIDLNPLIAFGQTGAAPTATLASVGTEKLTPTVLRGKQLFYDARDPRLARDSYMSCASCHNDAGHDGRTWDFTSLGEGLRNTISLRGRAGLGQGFLHWSANFDEVQDFEGQIRAFAGGTGLMADADFNAGTRSQPLGDRKAGLSADLDALAAYLGSLTTFTPSPWRNADGTLTTAALAGKTVFATSCASCHGGAGFTTSADGSQLKNIGTIKPSSGKRLNGTLAGIDIPTLRDVWATAPYLHDGSAATLAAAINAHTNVSLSATALANVVEYVQQIGSDEPGGLVPCASEGGNCVIPSGMTADVYYGVNGTHVMRSGLTGSVACGVASFGVDPVPGAYKSCAYVPTGLLTRTACGGPGALCSLPAGTVGDIFYGTSSRYSVRTGVTGAVCGSAFLNVNGTAAQSCSYVVTATPSPAPASALMACSGEGGTCTLPAGVTADVYYGINGKYAMRTGLSGNVGCNPGTFGGDPVPNVVKGCSYVATNTVSKTACVGDGGFCALPAGTSGDVYYGGGGRFAVRWGMSGVYCDAARFGGDPSPGVGKTCTYVIRP